MAKKKGLWIPEELLQDEELTLTEVLILAAIISLCVKDGCYAKNDYLAERCRCTAEMVSRTIRKGEKLGYITVRCNGKYDRNIQSRLTVESIRNDRTVNTNRPYGQDQLTVESIGGENPPIISNNKTFNKTFYYYPTVREEEQESEKNKNQIPTEEDVERYCAEMGYTWDARKFVRYNTARGWTVGGKPCADWRALADMWTDRDKDDAIEESSFDTGSFFQAALRRSCEENFGGNL